MEQKSVEMSRDKQIEEMAKICCKVCEFEVSGQCTNDFCEIGSCCIAKGTARKLYNAGYRKQSDPISCGHEKGANWVQLPCKVGDTLYVISRMKDKRFLPFINEYEVTNITLGKKKWLVYHEMDGYIKTFKQDDFGKTVFLSKAEAERVVTDNNVGVK